MPYKTIQQNFANGELNPKMQGRADVDMYYKSAQKMRDVVTTPYGGFVRRPGSRMISGLAETYEESNGKNIRLIPFVFNNEQSYLLAISEGKVEIFYKDVLIKTLSNSNFTNDNVMHIKYAQTADSCILVHKDFPPLRLLREQGAGSPNISNAQITDGWLVASGNGHLYTNFNLEVSPSQTLEAVMRAKLADLSYSSYSTFYLSSRNNGSLAIRVRGFGGESAVVDCITTGATIVSGSLGAEIPHPDDNTIYTIKLTRNAAGLFTFAYSTDDGETYTTVGTFTNSNFADGMYEPFFSVAQAGSAIDLRSTYIKRNNSVVWMYGYSGDWYLSDFHLQTVPEYDFVEASPTAGQTSATPNELDGTVTITLGASVGADLVGQYFEGNGGRVKITSQNGAKLTGYTIIGFYSTDTISAGNWTYTTSYEPVWSNTRGWPCSVTFHGGRLWFGGSKSRPQTVWGSKVGLFNKFDPTSGYDNDAIEFTLDTSDLNEITDIYSQRNLLIFTRGGEFVCASSYNEPITPNNVNAIKQTANGSWDKTRPVDIEGSVMFVERKGQGLMAFAASDNTTDIYNSANSSLINSHLINSPVDIAAERNNLTQQTNYVYLVNKDGTLCVVNLLASQGITGGYTLWATQGKYKSICVLPDDTYVAVERHTTEGYKLFLEKLTDSLVDGEITDSLNNATSYTNDNFANKALDVFLDGDFFGTFNADSEGKITFPEATGTAKIGYSFRWEVESNFLEIPQLGVGLNRKKRLATMTVRTLDTPELTVNGETQPGGEGIKDIEYYGIGDWSEHPTWIMQEQRPCKVNVMAVQMNVNYQVAGDEY